jgi:membrane-bound lytic murein transglycosylase A
MPSVRVAWVVALPLLLAPPISAEGLPDGVPSGVACDDLDLEPLAAALAQAHGVLSRRAGPAARFALPYAVRRGRGAGSLGARLLAPSVYARTTLLPLVELAGTGDKGALCAALGRRFSLTRLIARGAAHVTGYHTPTVRGAVTADETYRFPLYRRPRGALASLATAQILAGGLAGRGLELAWLADPYDALALHVEGCAKILLPDGRALIVGTDGHNGHPYTNVSKLLLADGKLAPGPAPPANRPGNPKARRYFAEHPGELERYWGKNPHFVFFRASDGPAGPLGPLTASRSVAVDPATVPLGSALLLCARKPVVAPGAATVASWQPFCRLVVAADVGAGIRGPGRVDLYFGDDDYALVAGVSTNVDGDLYLVTARE